MDKFYILFVSPGAPEILVILLVLLLLFGAKEAPYILRNISDFFIKIRNSADEFKHEIMYSDMRSEADEREKKQNAQYLTEDIEDNNIDDQNKQDGQDVEKI
tara:strand:+ start:359 stop:664 length:306 start_codon:yes stop_codon:yes gene_type:complete